jgi:hypothetical protein
MCSSNSCEIATAEKTGTPACADADIGLEACADGVDSDPHRLLRLTWQASARLLGLLNHELLQPSLSSACKAKHTRKTRGLKTPSFALWSASLSSFVERG